MHHKTPRYQHCVVQINDKMLGISQRTIQNHQKKIQNFRTTSSLNNTVQIQHALKNKESNFKSNLWRPIVQIFKTFVQQNRLPVHKRGKVKYLLLPHWTSIVKKKKSNTLSECSLDTTFNQMLQNLKQQGFPKKLSFSKNFQVLFNKVLLGIIQIGKVSSKTVERWMKKLFKDTTISPHYTDACPECCKNDKEITSLQQQILMNNVSCYYFKKTNILSFIEKSTF